MGAGGRGFQLNVEDLRGNPLAEMTRRHRPLDEPGKFSVNRIALAQQRRGPCERVRLHSRKCPTLVITPRTHVAALGAVRRVARPVRRAGTDWIRSTASAVESRASNAVSSK